MYKPQNLGDYELLKRIGGGGMADIYLARAAGIAGFEKYLAIKMIRENLSDDEEFIEMLVNEAKIAVRLNHNNIVQVFDLGRKEERYYIAMEYVDGHDLQALLVETARRGTYLPFEAAAYIVRETCAGLHYAHTRLDENGAPLGIVHRDVSPQNVLVGFNGEVKIADFGIAKANIARSETQVGILKGKFGYMSPEHAWGDKLDGRSDVFSMGIVLYEMLTGEMVHQQEDQLRLLDAVRRAQIPPPTAVRREIPSDLEAITMMALERDRKERFSSAGELQRELMRFLARTQPGYGQTDLASYVQGLFKSDIKRNESEFRARNMDASTRSVQIMGRNEFQPDESTSLVHGFDALRAMAAGENQEEAGFQRASGQDSTRPVGLKAQDHVSTVDFPAERQDPIMDSGEFFEEEDEPTMAYTPDEIRRAVSSGHPIVRPRAGSNRQWPDKTREAKQWEGDSEVTKLRDGWAEPSSDSIPLKSDDLLPVSIHDRAQARASENALTPARPQQAPSQSGRQQAPSQSGRQQAPSQSGRKPAPSQSGRKPAPTADPHPLEHRVLGRPASGRIPVNIGDREATIPVSSADLEANVSTNPQMRSLLGHGSAPVQDTGSRQMLGLWLLVASIVVIGVVAVLLVVLG